MMARVPEARPEAEEVLAALLREAGLPEPRPSAGSAGVDSITRSMSPTSPMGRR
jgi:hypothetical protein